MAAKCAFSCPAQEPAGLPRLNVFGVDYDTPDGTGAGDYVHVVDVAAGRLRALEGLEKQCLIKVNPGTGRGISVLELAHAF